MDKPGAIPKSALEGPQAADSLRRIGTDTQKLSGSLDDFISSLTTHTTHAPDGELTLVEKRYKASLGHSKDTTIRPFRLGRSGPRGLVVFLQSMVDDALLEGLMKALLLCDPRELPRADRLAQAIQTQVEVLGDISIKKTWHEADLTILDGGVAVFVEGMGPAIAAGIPGYATASISAPTTEQAIKGAKEAFSTDIWTQISQLRRRIKNKNLLVDTSRLGASTQMMTAVVCLENVASPTIVEEVRQRLALIAKNEIQDIGRLQQWLKDQRYSPFPQLRVTDRVDLVASAIVEGRVAIIADNNSYALLAPATLMDFYRTTQDYVVSFWESSLVRWVRLLSLAISLYLPGLFVALVMIHPGLIPPQLLRTVASSMQTVPFSPLMEVVLMWSIMEILREASLRLPQVMGQTISIVGGLVIGQAAVSAGLIGSPMIVVVALTAIATFTAPSSDISDAWRILLWPMIFSAYVLGLPGMALMTVIIVAHVSKLQSFGVPYLTPFAPSVSTHLDDTLMGRGPVWQHFQRSPMLAPVQQRLSRPYSPSHEAKPGRKQKPLR